MFSKQSILAYGMQARSWFLFLFKKIEMSKTKFGKDLLLLNCMLSDLLPIAPKQNSTDPSCTVFAFSQKNYIFQM